MFLYEEHFKNIIKRRKQSAQIRKFDKLNQKFTKFIIIQDEMLKMKD